MMDEKIAAERSYQQEVIAAVLAEAREVWKADRADEIRQLKIEVANLQSTIAEVRALLASDRGKRELPPLQTIAIAAGIPFGAANVCF